MSFFKNGEQEDKTSPVWGLAPAWGRGCKERVWEVNMVEYYALMYENGKMRPVETIPGMGERIKENDGGVNSTMIYCKNFCKCHNAPPVQYNNNKSSS
jgi:hypothetical protein